MPKELTSVGGNPRMRGSSRGTRDSPLVVVSNRLPFTTVYRSDGVHFNRSTGGLVSALEPLLSQRGGVWIGWSGVPDERLGSAGESTTPSSGRITYRHVPLSSRDVAQYYGGFSNRTLWPLLHYFIGRTQIDNASWRAYERVNEQFANVAVDAADRDALIWVHDYQLLRVPHYIRSLDPRRRIGFFLHVPFPAYDVFRILPWSRALLRGILASDLVGFHVGEYVDHFLTCAERSLGCVVDRSTGIVEFEGREVSVQAHPIGIDVAHIEELARTSEPPVDAASPGRVAEILGVDRLDYTKGINQRLLAVERLFERHPAFRKRAVFTQLAVPSREKVAEYRELKREVDETVGRINGRFSDRGWTPIRYLTRSVPIKELVGLYRHADVALLTPLRDGMNLVAKEYVASCVDDRGVLVLSEMTGAAVELQEALQVNPLDVEAVAESLYRALSMPDDERRARMSALRHRVRSNDVRVWATRFLKAAEEAATRSRSEAPSVVDELRRRLQPWLAQEPMVTLFLDFDILHAPSSGKGRPARLGKDVQEVLIHASEMYHLHTVIVSARPLDDLEALVAVPGLTYVASDGLEIDGPGVEYRHEALDTFRPGLKRAEEAVTALAVEGAKIERQSARVTCDLRDVPEPKRSDAMRRMELLLRRRQLVVARENGIIRARAPAEWHKGHAVLHVLVRRHGADWPSRARALYIGDDGADENAFRSLRGIGRSVAVGPSRSPTTSADFFLPNPHEVVELLRWLASGAFADPAA